MCEIAMNDSATYLQEVQISLKIGQEVLSIRKTFRMCV